MSLFSQKKRYRILLAMLAILVVFVLVDQVWVIRDRRLTISKATTYITSPIVDGYPDYLGALNSRDVPLEKNAAPLVFEAVGTGDAPAAFIQGIYDVWKLPVPTTAPLLVSYKDWLKTQPHPASLPAGIVDPEDEVTAAAKTPWTAADHAQLARWIAACGPAFDLLERASQRPEFFVPSVTAEGRFSRPANAGVLNAFLYSLSPMRAIATALTDRALLRLQEGDRAGFERDILTVERFSRLLAQQPTLIEGLVAIAIDSAASHAVQAAAVSDLLDLQSAQSLREKLMALGPVPTFARASSIGERFKMLDAFCTVRAHGLGSGVGPVKLVDVWLRILPLNYDNALAETNQYSDQFSAAFDLPTYAQRRAAFTAVCVKAEALTQAGFLTQVSHPENIIFGILLPDLSKVSELHTSCLIDRDLALTALSLRIYKLTNGKYPENLDSLKSPTFTPPLDRFTDAPLIYRTTSPGYLLYSVGKNLKDDGGTPRSTKTHDNYDIVVQCTR